MSLKSVPGTSWTAAGLWSRRECWSASHGVVPAYLHTPGTWSAGQTTAKPCLIHRFCTLSWSSSSQKPPGWFVPALCKAAAAGTARHPVLQHALLPLGDTSAPTLPAEHTEPQTQHKPGPERSSQCPAAPLTPWLCPWMVRAESSQENPVIYGFMERDPRLCPRAGSGLAYVTGLEVLIL